MTGIFPIVNEEIQRLAELYVEVFNGEPWNDQWTVHTAFERLHDIYLSPNFLGFKYLKNTEIKGAIFGNCEQWYEGMHNNLKEMFIATELQGTGIGSKMIKELEDRLKKLGVNTIYLFTSKGNSTDNFYIKNGFNQLDSMVMMDKEI